MNNARWLRRAINSTLISSSGKKRAPFAVTGLGGEWISFALVSIQIKLLFLASVITFAHFCLINVNLRKT